jgi:hypothetical protein
MSPQKQCFDFLLVLTGTQFQVTQPGRNILCSVFVSMYGVTANATGEYA